MWSKSVLARQRESACWATQQEQTRDKQSWHANTLCIIVSVANLVGAGLAAACDAAHLPSASEQRVGEPGQCLAQFREQQQHQQELQAGCLIWLLHHPL